MVRLWGFLAAVLLALVASPVSARDPHVTAPAEHYSCIAYGSLQTTFTEVVANPSRWACGKKRPEIVHERVFLRFDLAPGARTPHYFVSRRSVFDQISFLVVDDDGSTRTSDMPYSKVDPTRIGYMFKAHLPETSAATRTIYAAIDLPTQRIMLERALVAPDGPGADPRSVNGLFLLSAVCGMLLMPLILNLSAYRVLREPFLLWHTAMILSILALIMLSSGLYSEIFALSPMGISAAIAMGFAAFVASASMFAHSYLEPDRVSPFLRRLLPMIAIWAWVVGTLHAAFPFALRPVHADIYYAAHVPVLVLFIAGLADALRRGSRAVKFQLLGWAPLILLGIVRIATAVFPLGPATDAMPLFYLGIVLDVVATTIGVCDRFMSIRRDRDRAEAQARLAEDMSERDPLTSLLNRRAIEPRFAQMHEKGFDTLAILDLDLFKSVNDDFGHAKGDEVLKIAAEAMAPDDDTLAMRLGGEEFLLLLRGRNSIERAEHRRRAIPARVASGVDGLDRMITASMGVVTIPRDAMPGASFEDLYSAADRLLYEAKQAGRNRMASERMTPFAARSAKDRRAGDRRKKARVA